MKTIKLFKICLTLAFASCFANAFSQNSCNPKVEISAPKNSACIGERIKFTSKLTNIGTNPKYQWYTSNFYGTNKVGTDSADFTFQPDMGGNISIYLEVTSENNCDGTNNKSSEYFNLIVNSEPNLNIEITPNYFCNSTYNTFTLSSMFPNVTYNWYVNGNLTDFSTNEYELNLMSNFSEGNNVYVEAINNSGCGTSLKAQSNISRFNTEWCNANKGENVYNPKSLNYDAKISDTVDHYQKGRSENNTCKTSLADENVIDSYYEFTAQSEIVSVELNLDNADFEASISIIDPDWISINKKCENNLGTGLQRKVVFDNLNIGSKYIIRVEIGGSSPIGHARLNAVKSLFNLLLKSSTTDINDETLYSTKQISNIYNIQGIEVNKNYKGLVIYKYTDGTTEKRIQE